MLAIIIILVGIICLFTGYIIFRDVMKVQSDNKIDDVYVDGIDFEDKIKLDSIIGSGDSGLSFLLNKSSISDITNDDILYYLYRDILSDKYEEKRYVTFTAEEVKNAFQNSALSNLEYTDKDIIDNSSLKELLLWKYNSGIYSYNTAERYEKSYVTNTAYTYNVDSYVKDNKYVVVNKYLFINRYNTYPPEHSIHSRLYGNYNDCFEAGKDFDRSSSNYLKELDYYVYDLRGLASYAMENYAELKDKLDTYTYTFEKENGHFVLTDFSVERVK